MADSNFFHSEGVRDHSALNLNDGTNPHSTTKTDVGLANVTNEAQIPATEKGSNNGVATLDGSGKIPVAQLPNSVMDFLGAWDASTNTPSLSDGSGNNGDTYRCSVAGSQDLGSGSQTWAVGDFVIYNGSIWQQSPGPKGISNIVEDVTPQLGGALDTNSKQVRWSKGSDVASASSLTLGDDGNYFDITGTTSITSIATKAVGTFVMLHFDGILTLTHHATDLILPTGANITTAAGDEAIFVEYATGDWRCLGYLRASGKALDSTDDNAIHDNVAGEINAVTTKATPVGGDLILIEDSADSNNKKKITMGSIPGGPAGNYADDVKAYWGTGNDAYIVWNSASSYFELRYPQDAGAWLWNLGTATRWFGSEAGYSELRHINASMYFTTAQMVFNYRNNDVDFIIKKDDGTDALKYDAGDDKFTVSPSTEGITALSNYRNVMEYFYEFIEDIVIWRTSSTSNASIGSNTQVDGLFGAMELGLNSSRASGNVARVSREGNGNGNIKLGQGVYKSEYIIKTGSALPTTGVNDYNIVMGMTEILTSIGTLVGGGSPSAGSIQDGMYFWIDGTYTNWQCATVKNNTITNTDTGVASAINTKYNFKIEVNAGATEVKFYINDVLEATHTTNIPNDAYIGHTALLYSKGVGGGGSRNFYLDSCYERYEFTTQR